LELAQTTLLIVEDDLDVAEMLKAFFQYQGYEVLAANWGEDGLLICQSRPVNLVVLDIRLPDIDGFEVARRLRTNRRTRELPIIFLTEQRERTERLRGLALHADDYITKPFDVQELSLRIHNALERARRGSLTNPVTGLPMGSLVDERLEEWLAETDSSLLLVSILNLEPFREIYGFVASDDLLRGVSLILKDALPEKNEGMNFIGNITSADFLLILKNQDIPEIKESIQRRLEKAFDYFYSEKDRQSGIFGENHLHLGLKEMPQSQNFKNVQDIKYELAQLLQ
jgi:CheY-like chemotaxis protein